MQYKVWNIFFLSMIGTNWITVRKSTRTAEEVIGSLKLPVDPIKSILGTEKLEKNLKVEFEPHSVKGHENWYKPVPELLARIDSIEDYDGEEPPPPPPEPKVWRQYEDPHYYCSSCNGQFEVETDVVALDSDYIDYGGVHYSGDLKHGYLCNRCALEGGLTNIIYPEFYSKRESLAPYWEQSDENFLSKCSDDGPIDESCIYIWIKARVLTRTLYAMFIENHPSGSISDAKDFIIEALEFIERNPINRQ